MNIKVRTMLLIAILVFALVPVSISLITNVSKGNEYAQTIANGTVNTVAKSKANSINQLFKSNINDAKSMAQLASIKDFVASADDNAKKVLKEAISTQEGHDFIVTDNKGTIIYSVSGKAANAGVFQGFNDAMVSSDYVSSISLQDTYFETETIYFSTPITDGVLIKAVPASEILADLKNFKFLDTGAVALADATGNLINYNNGIVKHDDVTDQKLKDSILDTNVVASNSDDVIVPKNAAGMNLYMLKISDFTDWKMIAYMNNADVSGFATGNIMITLLIGLGCIAVCFGAGLLLRNSILKPMADMTKTMNQIYNSEDGERIRFNVKSSNEFGQISESFNNLLDEVVLSHQRHKMVADISDSILFEWDFQKELLYVSENFRKRFDLDITNATLQNGKFIDSLMDSEDADKYKRDMSLLIKNKNAYSNEYRAKNRNGDFAWISVRGQCITDRLGEILRVIGVITDIDNEKKMEIQLSERASYDFLSQLYNRNTFERELTAELDRRGHNKVAVMFIDLDDFKFINDRYGHSIGDEVIKYVADVIREKVDQNGGFAGRFGGDEFVLFINDKKDIDNIESVSQDIIDKLYTGYIPETGGLINILCSIGVAIAPEHGEKPLELLKHADSAMYFVKKNGKANYHIFTEKDQESSDDFFL